LQSSKRAIRKEAAWAVSNITAGSKQQTMDVINANLIIPVVALLSSGEFDVKKEATWAISNATTHKVVEHIR
jgi:importin subunit alpha-1